MKEILEKIERQAKLHHVKISELRAELIGCKVEVNVQVVGEASQKALPKTIEVTCRHCGLHENLSYDDLNEQEKSLFLRNVVFREKLSGLTQLIEEPCKEGKSHSFSINVVDYMDFTIVFVRDLLDPLMKFDQRVYQTRKNYLVNDVLPYAKKVTLKGLVVLEPKTRNITVIADDVEPYEDEVVGFQITDQDKEFWNRYFASTEPEQLLTQVAPSMAGRPLVQEALQLILHSVAIIPDIYGERVRGSLRGIFFGDTKTYKSKSGRDLTVEHYGFGDYILGEASSRTGITYTIDNDNHALIWGALAINDLGFLVIDGMHSLNRDEWRETREALESQRIVVRRSLSGEALARTRILGIYNPGPNKPMNTYLFTCQAAVDTFCFNDPPDVTRWDFFVPFSIQDVPKNDVVKAKPLERPIPDDVFVRHVFWAWSRRPEHIEYTEEARNKILEETQHVMEKYAIDDIPIVHLGYREVITRLAVAYAGWLHSTDLEHEKIIAREDHVERAIEFLAKIADSLELGIYKLEREGKLKITEKELGDIISDLDQVCLQIIEQIKIEAKSSSQLAELLDVSQNTIKRRYAILAKHQLIKTTPGRGIELSPRGIIFLKEYLGIKAPNSGTSTGEKVPKSGTMILAPLYTEKISELREWIITNKDSDSLIDQAELVTKCKQLGIEPQKVVKELLKDGLLFKVMKVGKFGVSR